MPNGLRIEHFCDIIPKAQRWLVLNVPVFMFVYIHCNVPPTIIKEMYQMKRFINMEQSPLSIFLLLSIWFVFSLLSYTADDSIYHFCIMIKDLHFFFKSDCCPRL